MNTEATISAPGADGMPVCAPAATRADWGTARLVREGILMQAMHGTGHAAAFLQQRMVNLDVALRVLLEPERRRVYARR